MPKAKKNPYKGKIILISVLCLLLLMTGGFAFMYRYYLNELQPVSEQSEEIAFTIEENSSMNAIISKLYDEGLIRNKDMAKVYVKLNRKNSYYAGNFILNRNMSFAQIIDTISDMSKASREQVSVTIAPGYWAKHAAAAIAEKTNLTAEEIMAKWNDVAYIDSLIAKYEVLTKDIFNSENCYLEGYIFPETYKFYENTTVEQVTEKILDQTEKVYDKYKDQISKSSFNTHELFTLASVILFEANTEEDMRDVMPCISTTAGRSARRTPWSWIPSTTPTCIPACRLVRSAIPRRQPSRRPSIRPATTTITSLPIWQPGAASLPGPMKNTSRTSRSI